MSGDDEFVHDMQDETGLHDPEAPEEFYEGEPVEGAEGEAAAEDWESYDSEFSEDAAEAGNPPPKKPMSNLMMASGVAVLVLGTVLFLAAHHRGPPKAVSSNANAGQLPGVGETHTASAPSPSPALTSGQPAPAADTGGGPKGGMLNDPAALNSLAGNIQASGVAAPGQPAAAAPAGGEALTPMPAAATAPPLTAAAQSQPLPLPAAVPQPQEPMPVSSPSAKAMVQQLPANSAFMKAGSQTAGVIPAPAPSLATTPPGISEASENAKLDQLLDRVSALENKMADLQQVQQSVKQLDDRISHLESTGAQAPQSPLPAAAAPPVSQDLTQPVAAPASQQEAPVTQPPAHHAHKHDISHGHPSGDKSDVHWELKSAEPGQAYVSPPGRDDMVNIHVGDTLPGVGRITAISESGGQWIVTGTEGKITE
jgi:hypothetical protein